MRGVHTLPCACARYLAHVCTRVLIGMFVGKSFRTKQVGTTKHSSSSLPVACAQRTERYAYRKRRRAPRSKRARLEIRSLVHCKWGAGSEPYYPFCAQGFAGLRDNRKQLHTHFGVASGRPKLTGGAHLFLPPLRARNQR
jgi:hypothetical protein